MPIVLLILGALGLLTIGAGWLQNVTGEGAKHMHVDVFGWTLGPLSHGAWLLVASLLGMATIATLLGAFALFRRSRRTRGAAKATARAAGVPHPGGRRARPGPGHGLHLPAAGHRPRPGANDRRRRARDHRP